MARPLKPPAARAEAPASLAAFAAALLLVLGACAAPRLAPHRSSAVRHVAGVPTVRPSPTPAPAYPQSRPMNEARPVRVRSRSLRYLQQTQETVFYGGVTTTQDSTVILSKELLSRNQGQSARADGGVLMRDAVRRFWVKAGRADYTDLSREALLSKGVHLVSVDPYGNSITVTGQSGTFSALSRGARVDGGVMVSRGILKARADDAVINDGGAQLVLENRVRLSLGYNRMQSDWARFDEKDHAMDLEGDVRLRLIPDELRAVAAAPWNVSPSAVEGP